MMDFGQFSKYLDIFSIDEQSKKEFIDISEPCFKFNDFIKNKYRLETEDVENIIQLKLACEKEKFLKGASKLDVFDYSYLIASRMSAVIAKFAKEEGFVEYDKLEMSLKKLLILGLQKPAKNLDKNIKI